MRRFFLLLGVGLVAPSLSSCLALGYALSDDCEDPECTGNGGMYCRGNQVVECSYWEGDPCVHAEFSVVDDCGAHGMRCVEDHCESAPPPVPREPCVNGIDGVCKGNVAYRCEKGGLGPPDDCAALGVPCQMVVSHRHSLVELEHQEAVCGISTEPCQNAFDGGECQGTSRVLCHHGFPIQIEACEEDLTCKMVWHSGQPPEPLCTYAVPCLPNAGRLCHDGVVYGCLRGSETERLRDCSEHGEQCVERAGQTYCAAFSTEPPPGRWLPIPAGSFQPGSGPNRSTVTLGAFEMMQEEVTEAEYEACRASGACPPVSAECRSMYSTPFVSAELPATCIDFQRAQAYCASVGGRLPSELEWEYALRNAGAEVSFPWGADAPSCVHAIVDGGCGRSEPWPGCSRADDVTQQGICDLVGNVVEWVETAMNPPQAATRGMSYVTQWNTNVDLRVSQNIGDTTPYFWNGFRCVR